MFNKKETPTDRDAKKKARDAENDKLVYDTWPQTREQGKLKFTFRFGALTWGFPTFLIYSAIMIILNFFIKESVKYNIMQAAFSLFFFILFGMIYGLFLWKKNEKVFLKKYPYGKKTK
ncbi:hypothetical protein QE109_00235 [Fusibacter bizertensis]|uniref:DUF2628 domain-containing protein n=1 Tax=Fusibacter bizertensis TaxID=1488331 RepID=A0ABT6N819_9FIRM|nr:hypothetical protein [Fusibacter bizertensis]MDH8676546.1 hypothetical protein [Fusibacter bizertensis]